MGLLRDIAKGLPSEVLEILNKNFFDIEAALANVGAFPTPPPPSSIGGGGSSVSFPITISQGGTGATDALNARNNLGLGTLATLSSVDATKIDNRSRSIWVPYRVWGNISGSESLIGTFPNMSAGFPMDGITAGQITTGLVLPSDFVSVNNWYILYSTTGTNIGNVHLDLYYNTLVAGDLVDSAYDQTMGGNFGGFGTNKQLKKIAIGNTTTGLAPGDYVRLTFQRDPANAGDTLSDDIDFLGLLIDYQADM